MGEVQAKLQPIIQMIGADHPKVQELQQAICSMNGPSQPTAPGPSPKPKMSFRGASLKIMTEQQVLHLLSPTLHPLGSTDTPESPPPVPAPPESKTRQARDSDLDYLPNEDDYELDRLASVYNGNDTIVSASQKSKFIRREAEKNLPLGRFRGQPNGCDSRSLIPFRPVRSTKTLSTRTESCTGKTMGSTMSYGA